MPNLFDDWDDEQAPDGSGAGDDAEEADGAEALKARIAELPEGSQLRKLYEEALALRGEREAKAQADAEALALLESGAESGFLDFGDPAVQDALRFQVAQKQAELDARVLAETEAVMRKRGYGEEDIAREAAKVKEDQAALAEFTRGSDLLDQSPVWQAHLRSVVEQERADTLAYEMRANRPGQWEREVEEAQAGIDATVDAVLE